MVILRGRNDVLLHVYRKPPEFKTRLSCTDLKKIYGKDSHFNFVTKGKVRTLNPTGVKAASAE
ncbi:hypothetical protein BG006_011499, partial [Podila minutissima]